MIDLTEIAREITIDDCYQEEVFDMREDIYGDKTIPIQVVESLRKVIDYLFDEDQQEELGEYFMEAESDDIKLAIDEFEGDYEEEDLRLFRIKFLSEVAN